MYRIQCLYEQFILHPNTHGVAHSNDAQTVHKYLIEQEYLLYHSDACQEKQKTKHLKHPGKNERPAIMFFSTMQIAHLHKQQEHGNYRAEIDQFLQDNE